MKTSRTFSGQVDSALALVSRVLALIGMVTLLVIVISVMRVSSARADCGKSMADAWAALNDICRGGVGEETVKVACEAREKLGAKLDHTKGCVYGNHGAYDPNNDAYVCK
jgi:hypothetical protein